MKVTSAEFVKSAFKKEHWLEGALPEIAFLGRSNVGKSSLINCLLGRRSLARTSNTPGRTQSINFYVVNDAISFADLPGYGYAKVSKKLRASWGEMAETYLAERENLVLCVQLFDVRHPPTVLDLDLNEWLREAELPSIRVGTKSDKLSANMLLKNVSAAAKYLTGEAPIAFSSVTGKGCDEVWGAIQAAVSTASKFAKT